MPDHRRLSLAAGVLYLLTFVTSIPAAALYVPLLAGGAHPDPSPTATGAVLEIVLAVSCIGTAVVLAPVVRRVSEVAALGFVAARTTEAALILVGVATVLTLSALRVAGAAADDPSAELLVEAHRWAFLLGPGLIPAINALCLAPALYRGRLVPRAIPIVGMIGIPLLLASATATVFGVFEQTSPLAAAAAAPIALWELSLGLWLTFAGFRNTAVDALV
ncbi:DUF4386 domain-containing protein [Protaetiibacter mangrovi]|uniref:DUF4386 domain-containing protein n=1 Tax=Protaetiibacter mangrovi TaxID=2970926 RepID=A0ABT1ZH30_9MICO|nr:DUF4386 domain-containing protein [Protaetiibacter mangrovi]MCS0500023.1 DUF4386 domain-containing protein [Protaetiibacter mangrovi]